MGNQKPEVEEKPTTQWPKEKGQTLIYKTLHRKLKIEQHESHKKAGWTGLFDHISWKVSCCLNGFKRTTTQTPSPQTLFLSFFLSFFLIHFTHINVRNIHIHACSIKYCCSLLYIGEEFISLFNLCLILFAHLSKLNLFNL